jgi:chromosome segregation ATPase
MPNYEEIVKQSQKNIKALSAKINELDELYKNIEELTKQPEILNKKFQEIDELSKKYTNDLGVVTKKYLEGNNILFTEKLKELSDKKNELQKEIARLADTDFTKLFQKLQETFIEQTKKDIAEELKKFDEKSELFQIEIDNLKVQVERLEGIDLEKHFNGLQKNLSDIFGSINSINSTLTNITQTLQNIIQSLGDIQTSINNNQKEIKQSLEKYYADVEKHLDNQDKELSTINYKLKSLEEQNSLLEKEIKKNQIILWIFSIVSLLLLFIIYGTLRFKN